jgi:DNA-binding MarR family transcriptional regulator
MPTKTDIALVASDLRVVLGQLIRRLRAENGLSLSHGAVLGRLDRCGPQSVSDLAVGERVRPQSMAQTVADLETQGLVSRSPDPSDRRRTVVAMTDAGKATLEADRGRRVGWLAEAIEDDLSPQEQALLAETVALLRRLAER